MKLSVIAVTFTGTGDILKLSKREGSHLRHTPAGMVLVGTRTGAAPLQFPPEEFVHGDDPVEEVEIGPAGCLYTYTLVHPGKDIPPYGLAMVDFDPGVRVFGRLLFEEQPPAIGSTLRIVPHALPDGTPDYAFRAA